MEVEMENSAAGHDQEVVNSDETERIHILPRDPTRSNRSGPKRKLFDCALAFVPYLPLKFYSTANISVSVQNTIWLIINILKIGILTKFTYDVGILRSEFGVLVTAGTISLQHLLLKNWDASFETPPYPPGHGDFAVYSISSLEESINFAVSQYYNAEHQATGHFTRTEQDNMDINMKYFIFNNTVGRHSKIEVTQTSFKPDHGLSNKTTDGITEFSYNITKELEFQKLPSVLQSVLSIRINMSMHSVRVFENADARCFVIYVNVTFSDETHNGQVKVQLKTLTPTIPCSDMNLDVQDRDKRHLSSDGYYVSAVLFLIVSIAIEFIAVLIWIAVCCGRCCCTCKEAKNVKTVKHFWGEVFYGFVESLLSLIGDILAVFAIINIKTKYQGSKTLRDLDKSVVMLGCGLLLSYITLLKFMKINKRFSILFNTLKKSATSVLSFLVCVVIFFFGFWLFGFIVLGTYQTVCSTNYKRKVDIFFLKFSEPVKTADTLFSVINGDEIYATLAMIQDEYAGDVAVINAIMHVFVYTYVTVFTVLIFNLVIALFNSAYEEVKQSSGSELDENNLEKCLTQLLKLAKKHCDGGQTLESLLGSLRNRLGERRNYGTTGQNSVNSLLTDVLKTVKDKPAANITVDVLLTELLKMMKNNSPGLERLDELIGQDQDQCPGLWS